MQELQPRSAKSTRTNTEKNSTEERSRPGTSFKAGVVSLTFLVLGYQICLFMNRSTALRIAAARDHPDTVYVYLSPPPVSTDTCTVERTERHNAPHPAPVEAVRRESRRVESFPFNPNSASVEELQRLGFSEKQAASIEAYRAKGGRFHRPADFAKSYVVADSVFSRLQPFIRIPAVDINVADSSAFDALPGIGPYFASKMVWWREQLGGYSCVEQLTDIYNFTPEKLESIRDLIVCRNPRHFDIWSATEEQLAAHPYIRRRSTAHSIVLYREHHAADQLTAEGLLAAGVIDEQTCLRLGRLTIQKGTDCQ